MSKDRKKKDKEDIDILKPLPSNLDVLPTEILLSYAEKLEVGNKELRKKREVIIEEIRKAHASKRLREIRNVERGNRLAIPTEVKRDWAKRRLMKDFKEIQSTKLDYVCALPLRADIFKWHVNLLSPKSCRYYPMVLHMILTFSEDYPLVPPKCKLLTPIHHSHVFSGGDYICLDLLETHYSSQSYCGWSTSYSVLSILFQLQSFLFEDKDTEERYGTTTVRKDIQKSTRIVCECGHNPSKREFFPIWSYWGKDVRSTYFSEEHVKRKKKKKKKKKNRKVSQDQLFWGNIPSEVIIYIFQFLDHRILLRFSNVSRSWRNLTQHPFLWKNEIKCFHSKMNFREDSLGMGLNIQKKFKKIHQISTPLDIIGKHSFFHQKIKKSSWNVPFTHWTPLFIDQKHWKEGASKDFEKLVMEVYNNNNEKFEPHLAVNFCCKLMTSMVVEIMKGEIHGSIKAIQGYSYFYRILIYYVLKYPNLRTEIDYNIGKFIEHERYRHKKYIPNLGDFIALLSVSKLFVWDDVKESFINELFDRNTLWMERKRDIIIEEEKRKNGDKNNKVLKYLNKKKRITIKSY